jgi:hypothetical protein
MNRFAIALIILLSTVFVAGQSDHSVNVTDFPAMVRRGLEVIARRPYRYATILDGHKNITLEVDANASIRVKSYNSRTGVTGECVIIGERIYHRSGNAPWTSQSKDEFQKAQVQLTAAIKDARSKKDTVTQARLLGLTINNFAIFYALYRPLSTAVYYPNASGISDKRLKFVGERPYKRKVARFFRWTGNYGNGTAASNDSVVRTEILYAFDQQTGALLMAETRRDWEYESMPKTQFEINEWEPDTAIVITAPVGEDLKR